MALKAPQFLTALRVEQARYPIVVAGQYQLSIGRERYGDVKSLLGRATLIFLEYSACFGVQEPGRVGDVGDQYTLTISRKGNRKDLGVVVKLADLLSCLSIPDSDGFIETAGEH